MADLSEIMNLIPTDQIAKQLGVDPSVAKAAVSVALPAIVGGLGANAQDAGGAAALESTLSKHTNASTNLSSIDTADGAKIVKHVFGPNTDKVTEAAAAKAPAASGVDMNAIVAQVLPIIAPIVLSYLAQQFTQGSAPAKTSAPAASSASSAASGVGAILGSLLSSPETQSAIGGLLGSLLGGGTKS